MTKRIFIASMVIMLAIGFCAVQAQAAYTDLRTPVAISATATITGATENLTVDAVDQSTSLNPSSAIAFSTIAATATLVDSARAIRIYGGTNTINARVIVYTDNNTNTTAPNKAPTVNPNTGVDGSGMVGQTEPGYVVPLLLGINSAANGDPNLNVNYVFDTNTNDGIGEAFIVDKRHTHTFTGQAAGLGLDNVAMYTLAGAAVTNTSNDTLYPQAWDADYYDKINTDPTRVIISEALYKNIATVAYAISPTTTAMTYNCNTANMTTSSGADFVTAQITGSTATTLKPLYVHIEGDFTGRPAQTYSTAKLMVGMVSG